jgi:hypothetical protein
MTRISKFAKIAAVSTCMSLTAVTPSFAQGVEGAGILGTGLSAGATLGALAFITVVVTIVGEDGTTSTTTTTTSAPAAS